MNYLSANLIDFCCCAKRVLLILLQSPTKEQKRFCDFDQMKICVLCTWFRRLMSADIFLSTHTHTHQPSAPNLKIDRTKKSGMRMENIASKCISLSLKCWAAPNYVISPRSSTQNTLNRIVRMQTNESNWIFADKFLYWSHYFMWIYKDVTEVNCNFGFLNVLNIIICVVLNAISRLLWIGIWFDVNRCY